MGVSYSRPADKVTRLWFTFARTYMNALESYFRFVFAHSGYSMSWGVSRVGCAIFTPRSLSLPPPLSLVCVCDCPTCLVQARSLTPAFGGGGFGTRTPASTSKVRRGAGVVRGGGGAFHFAYLNLHARAFGSSASSQVPIFGTAICPGFELLNPPI